MAIVPDGKDWTWVLQRPCPECGYAAAGVPCDTVSARIRASLPRWAEVLTFETVRVRPAPDTWSPLEYACHVRDVLRIYDYRLGLMLTQDGPSYPNWDQDETAVTERYAEQDPATVAAQLQAAGEQIAAAFDTVHGDQWQRTGFRSDGATFTIDSFSRYFLHDLEHHLVDVGG